jgi:hypothetical protein
MVPKAIAFLAIAALGLVLLATQASATRPLSSTVPADEFELRFDVPKNRYRSGERIDAVATLTYHGPMDRIEITTAGAGPLYFGVESNTGHKITPGWRDKQVKLVMERGVPLAAPFMKSGGSSPDDPEWDFFRAYVTADGLRLPAATWRLWVMTHLTMGDPQSPTLEIEASVRIEVVGSGGTE